MPSSNADRSSQSNEQHGTSSSEVRLYNGCKGAKAENGAVTCAEPPAQRRANIASFISHYLLSRDIRSLF